MPEVYQYAALPQPFRVQVVHIWQRALPRDFYGLGSVESVWAFVEREVAEEHGKLNLRARPFDEDSFLNVCNYFFNVETDAALDVVEIVWDVIDSFVLSDWSFAQGQVAQHPAQSVDDLNERFREHNIGYQLVEGQVVRVDSQYLHAEAVKPALALLQGAGFTGPEDEFMSAHKHYREGKYKEALNEALKAFESTMKAICTARKWSYDKNKDTAKTLIETVLREELVPAYLQTTLGGLRSLLESAVPTTRNRESGHGQGPQPKTVPSYVAAYALHATAANIVFLVEAHKAKR